MRGIAVFMFSFAIVSGAVVSGAGASSIVVLSAKQATDPSIVMLGDAHKADSSLVTAGATEPGATASPSVIVLGDPAVNTEKVAAIPAGEQQPRAGGVMVIRAGVVGGSSAAPAATAAKPPASTAKASDSISAGVKASNGTLRDAMTQAGNAPAMPQ
jgi:hypothetical protein